MYEVGQRSDHKTSNFILYGPKTMVLIGEFSNYFYMECSNIENLYYVVTASTYL